MYRIIINLPKNLSSETFQDALRRSTEPVFRGAFPQKDPGVRTPSKIIKLDASHWTTVLDFYHAILRALGAPDWHGCNPNALVDSMVWGGINKVEPPFEVEVCGTAGLPADILAELNCAVDGVRSAKGDFFEQEGYEREISFEIAS